MTDIYKDSCFGKIPSCWNVKTLNDLTNITRLAGAEYSELWEVDKYGEIIALRGFNIGKNKIDLNEVDRISTELSNRLIRSKLFRDDIVFPCVGTIGKAYRILENDKFHINQNIAKITPSNKIESEYLTHYLLSEFTMKQILKYNTSSSQPNVLVGNLRRFEVIVPPLSEQQKIAKILSTVDSHIDQVDSMINDLKELKNGLMQKLLTEGIGHTEFKDSKVGRIPVEWEVKKLKELYIEGIRDFGSFSSTKQIDYVDEGVVYLRSENFRGNMIKMDSISYITTEVDEILNKSYIYPGNLLFTKIGNIGCAAVYNGEYGKRINSNATIAKMMLDSEIVSSVFASYYLVSNGCVKQYKGKIISTPPRINMGEISNIEIPLPPIYEQNKIVEMLSVLDNRIGNYNFKKIDLQQLKKGLMQQLLTGKTRVKIDN